MKSFLKKYKWLALVLLSLVIALVLRVFFVESYRVPSSQMENAVLRGDYVFVNKTAYGFRIPKIGTFHPEKVFFKQQLKRNDIVVYKSPLSMSRCIGLPGDSIEVKGGKYMINGTNIPQSPDAILPYKHEFRFSSVVNQNMKKLQIPFRETNVINGEKIRYLSRFEVYSLRETLPDSIKIPVYEQHNFDYKLFIPKKGYEIEISPQTLPIYQHIITEENDGNAIVKNGKLYINAKYATSYQFKKDYYWLLSDNAEAAADSRHFGFISENKIVGKAWMVWFSKDPSFNVLGGYRMNRVFITVN